MFVLFELALPFQLSTSHGFLRDLLGKALLELEEPLFFHQRLVSSIQSDQKQIGQYRRTTERPHARLSWSLASVPSATRS